nr:hydrolase 1, exosortase A system-associated [Sphingomonas sp. TREG-RG-20F-R18-01]
MRRIMAFACAGETLLGTLDEAAGRTGLLIVSGGNEIRIGAHRGMALLARRVAEQGIPVFRFDRRGVGDSTGTNAGFLSSAPDIAAAVAYFRQEAALERLVAFGNCDAATALALFGADAGVYQLILANPWVIPATDDLPAPAAIRARYAAKLRDPREWLRLARGGVHLGKLYRGLMKALRPNVDRDQTLIRRVSATLDHAQTPSRILLAERDNTAIAFRDAWKTLAALHAHRIPIAVYDTASHSFAGIDESHWLADQIVMAVREP